MIEKVKTINYVSSLIMPMIILIIILFGIKEKIKVYDVFLDGVQEGIHIVVKLFPTLLGIFIAIGMLSSSGIIELIVNVLSPIMKGLHIPSQIVPLIIIRPISGSSAIAVATDIMKVWGVDSKIGRIASVIMGATETIFYTISVYTSNLRNKKYWFYS